MTTPTPTLLLVHGSWHGPWCWERVVSALARLDRAARTVRLPSCSADRATWAGLAGDAEAVASAAAEVDGPVVVVGHSYGGVAISAAAQPANVRGLVYLGAFMPDSGRSLVSYLPPGPLPPYVTIDGPTSMYVAEQMPRCLYNTCTPEDAAAATAQLVPQDASVVAAPIGEAAWRRLPSEYILLERDQAVPPALQRTFAAQATRTHRMDTDHSPFLCAPDALARLLHAIAT